MPDLKQQIAILYDMEINNFLMTRLIDKLNSEISQLGIPTKQTFHEPQKQSQSYSGIDKSLLNFNTIHVFVIGFAIAIIVSIVNTLTTTYLPTNDGPFDKIGNFIVMFIISGIVGLIIGAILESIRRSIAESKYQKEANLFYHTQEEKYNQQLKLARKHYNERVAIDNNRVQKELRLQKILIETKNALVQRKNESTQRLQNMYTMTSIDSMFWALIPMAYMHLFSRLDIATTLGGENGLYAKVLNELKQDQFQKELFRKLDRISSQLDEMNNNQRNIYQQLVNLNHKGDTMINQTIKFAEMSAQNNQLLENAVKNTDIAKYNSERIRKELEYQNMMEYDRRYYN